MVEGEEMRKAAESGEAGNHGADPAGDKPAAGVDSRRRRAESDTDAPRARGAEDDAMPAAKVSTTGRKARGAPPLKDADTELRKDMIMATDLEADIRQLREDVAALTKQLALTTQHGAGAARSVALEGVDSLRLQGEAAIDALRSNARDLEHQLTASVREKPVTALAIAAGIGFLFALFTRR